MIQRMCAGLPSSRMSACLLCNAPAASAAGWQSSTSKADQACRFCCWTACCTTLQRCWSCCPKYQSQCKPGMLRTSSMLPCREEMLSQHKPADRLIGMSAIPGQSTDGLRPCCREKHSRRRRSRSRGGESDDEYGGYVPRKRQDIPSTCEAACLYCAKYLSFCPASVAPLPSCLCSVMGAPCPDCSCSPG